MNEEKIIIELGRFLIIILGLIALFFIFRKSISQAIIERLKGIWPFLSFFPPPSKEEETQVEQAAEAIADQSFKEFAAESKGKGDATGELTVTPSEEEKPPPHEISEEETIKVSESVSVKIGINWDKVGSLFWLGNDLMWVNDMMYRGAHPKRVIDGVEKAIQYSTDLGFGNLFPTQQLRTARSILESLDDLDQLDETTVRTLQQQYRPIIEIVESVKFFITRLAVEKQPGFKKL